MDIKGYRPAMECCVTCRFSSHQAYFSNLTNEINYSTRCCNHKNCEKEEKQTGWLTKKTEVRTRFPIVGMLHVCDLYEPDCNHSHRSHTSVRDRKDGE